MPSITEQAHPGSHLPEKVLQFGGGVFLRGFVADFIDRAIRAGDFGGRIVIAQRAHDRRSEAFAKQNGLYTLWLRGKQDGRLHEDFRLIGAVSRVLSTDTEWERVLDVARSPELEVILSNATEVGYAADPADSPASPRSYPAKLTAALHARWTAKQPGVVVMPCELLERNGEKLRTAVVDLAGAWRLPAEFAHWVADDNVFCSTLVDRIVTGPPAADSAEEAFTRLGYRDDLLIAAEPYALFAIEDQGKARERFPIHRASPQVLYTDDATPYWERKLRLLNSPHTLLSATALLQGISTVRDAMADAGIQKYLHAAVFGEIVPSLDATLGAAARADTEHYARQVLERFENPYVEHKLLNICFHCTTKTGVRLFPIIRNFQKVVGGVPREVLRGIANVITLFHDPARFPFEDAHRAQMESHWRNFQSGKWREFAVAVLSDSALWGGNSTDAAGLADALAVLFPEQTRPPG